MANEATLENQLSYVAYELDMLQASAVELLENSEDTRTEFLRHMAFECFWLHARNLIEFLKTKPNSDTIVAATFTGKDTYGSPVSDDIYQKIQSQISHLKRERLTTPRLTGIEVEVVRTQIEAAMLKFQADLQEAFKPLWVTRTLHTFNFAENWIASATNAIQSMSIPGRQEILPASGIFTANTPSPSFIVVRTSSQSANS